MKEELSKSEWSYYDDMFPEAHEDGFNSDSDFDYDDSYTKKKAKPATGGKRGGSKPKGVSLTTLNPVNIEHRVNVQNPNTFRSRTLGSWTFGSRTFNFCPNSKWFGFPTFLNV